MNTHPARQHLALFSLLACLLLGGCQDRRDPVKPTTAVVAVAAAAAAVAAQAVAGGRAATSAAS